MSSITDHVFSAKSAGDVLTCITSVLIYSRTSHNQPCDICNRHLMPSHNAIVPFKFYISYGAYVINHLSADAAGLTGSDVAVVALLEVNAYFRGGFHFKAVHSFASVRINKLVSVSSHYCFSSPEFFVLLNKATFRLSILMIAGR